MGIYSGGCIGRPMNRDDFQRQVSQFSGTLDEAIAEATKYDGQIDDDRPLAVSIDDKWCLVPQSTYPIWAAMVPKLAFSPLDELQNSVVLSMIADLLNE
jgi:hypothetical protein